MRVTFLLPNFIYFYNVFAQILLRSDTRDATPGSGDEPAQGVKQTGMLGFNTYESRDLLLQVRDFTCTFIPSNFCPYLDLTFQLNS